MFKYIEKDKSLSAALQSDAELSDSQVQTLTRYMLRVPYFQDQLIAAVSADPSNAWITGLPRAAQVRYLSIVTLYIPKSLEDPSTQNKIAKKLLNDKDIGPLFAKQFGDNPDGKFLSSVSNTLNASAKGGALHMRA